MKGQRLTNVLLSIITICLVLLTVNAFTGNRVNADSPAQVRIVGGRLDSVSQPVKIINAVVQIDGERPAGTPIPISTTDH